MSSPASVWTASHQNLSINHQSTGQRRPWRSVAAVLGWAPYAGRGHALALGGVGVLLATLGAITMGKFGPGWFSLANIVIALPCGWAGGRLWATSSTPRLRATADCDRSRRSC